VALTAAQIITLATQIAKCPGFTDQALQLLNAVLQELAQDYDFQVIRKTYNFQFDTGAAGLGYAPGSGPNLMPPDFLRLHRGGGFYQIFQVPHKLIGVTQEEFDSFVQQPGLASYPYLAYVDVAPTSSGGQAGLYVWPPASGAYPATVRYNPQMPDITDTSTVPWFPNSNYLYTRVAGELMKITNDDRWQAYLGDPDGKKDTAGSACNILRGYLTMKDDPETAPKTVQLDRRLFKANIATVRNTKTIGW
jgi:hypothetical protein